MIRFTFLAENKTDNPGFEAEHGLSVYIETPERKILFDTGATRELFLRNAKRSHVDLKDVDLCVISHGHYDHTEGVPTFCKINEKAPVYIHKDGFKEFYGMENGIIDDYTCGIVWPEDVRKELEHRLVLTDGPVWITDNIVISGTIPDVPGSVMPEKFFYKDEDGTMADDSMSHEQFLAIRNEKSEIFVFSGCSHKGIVPAIEYAKTLFPNTKIACVVAGMHLYGVTDEVRKQVVDKVIAEVPGDVMPVHCTGIDAICMLKTALGDRCKVATTGDRYEYL